MKGPGLKGIRKGAIKAEKITSYSSENDMIQHNDGSRYESLDHKKLRVMKIAKELCYSTSVIDAIFNAKSKFEIDRIMTTARRGGFSR